MTVKPTEIARARCDLKRRFAGTRLATDFTNSSTRRSTSSSK
eukprot:CAMPEP_0206522856 /NCGR_PEP_ID=MMETSP0324_2-20121206/67256_1 /ASSEMBLY_ACC=CAM_ASM_000836 /TAXON_ID=2866 /ORGANISM="Crypthecodinium cohnii, Strain Seligo" /LENGTH=41 /DNA_ID= /DNA_START= /DNA_END= /DNA_ORIENTATION=